MAGGSNIVECEWNVCVSYIELSSGGGIGDGGIVERFIQPVYARNLKSKKDLKLD